MAKENTGANQLLGSNPVIPKGVFVFDSNTGIVLVGDGSTAFRSLLRKAQTAQRGSVKVNWGNVGGAIADQTDLQTEFGTKQDTLVSGTNIKTVNSNSLLGSGDLTITASAAWGGITGTLSDQTDLATALGNRALTSTTVNGHALSSNVTVTKGDVGLGSVENTALSTWSGTQNVTLYDRQPILIRTFVRC